MRKVQHLEEVSIYLVGLCDLFCDPKNVSERLKYNIPKERSRSSLLNTIIKQFNAEHLMKEGKI